MRLRPVSGYSVTVLEQAPKTERSKTLESVNVVERDHMPTDFHPLTIDQPATYQIKVQGRLSENWSNWFDGLTVAAAETEGGPTLTTLTGQIADQAALHGLLNRIRDLGLPLLLVECLNTH
jgi:hypothetical protein